MPFYKEIIVDGKPKKEKELKPGSRFEFVTAAGMIAGGEAKVSSKKGEDRKETLILTGRDHISDTKTKQIEVTGEDANKQVIVQLIPRGLLFHRRGGLEYLTWKPQNTQEK